MNLPKKISILATLFFIFSSAYANEVDVSKWSLRYLARASNSLLAANDAALEKQSNVCKIPADQIQSMTMKLRILIDRKIAQLSPKQKQVMDQQALKCESECSCDIYSLVYEKIENPENQKSLASLNERASKVDSNSRKACAEKFQEFCTSQLIKYLSN